MIRCPGFFWLIAGTDEWLTASRRRKRAMRWGGPAGGRLGRRQGSSVSRGLRHGWLSWALPVMLAVVPGVFVSGVRAADDGATRDLTVEQVSVFEVQAPPPSASSNSLTVVAWVDRADNTYAIGEKVRLFVQTNRDAYVTVMNVGPSGNTTVLFPNTGQQDTRVRAGQPLQIPAANSGVDITIQGPSLGRELIKVVATTEPIALFSPTGLASAGAFFTIHGGSRSVTRDLQLTVGDRETQEWDDYNKVITTVASRPAIPAPVSWPSANGIRIAADKASYRPGEAVTLYVQTSRPCWLTLLNVGSSGQTRVLLPNIQRPRYLLPPGQPMVFPGPGIRLSPVGPAGIETVTAVCGADERSILPGSPVLDQHGFAMLNAHGTRDLALTADVAPYPLVHATTGFLVTQ